VRKFDLRVRKSGARKTKEIFVVAGGKGVFQEKMVWDCIPALSTALISRKPGCILDRIAKSAEKKNATSQQSLTGMKIVELVSCVNRLRV
jgi:hypothetical protein